MLRKNTYEILSKKCKTKPIFNDRIKNTGDRRQNEKMQNKANVNIGKLL